MIVKLLTEQHLEFLSLKGGCTGSSESTLVKMPYCWKSHVTAQILLTGLGKDLWGLICCMMNCTFRSSYEVLFIDLKREKNKVTKFCWMQEYLIKTMCKEPKIKVEPR